MKDICLYSKDSIIYIHPFTHPFTKYWIWGQADDLDLIFKAHMVEGENQLGKLSSGLHTCTKAWVSTTCANFTFINIIKYSSGSKSILEPEI